MICIEILDPVNAVVAEFQISVNFFTISKKRILNLICPIFLTGNLGGTFGFFLGMSLITLLEFLDFTFRRILNLFKPKRNTRAITAEN